MATGDGFDTTAQQDAFTLLSTVFTSYGLAALVPTVKDYIVKGYSPDTITLLLEQTDAFKARFPAWDKWSAQGHTVADYVSYENNARDAETATGLPSGFLTSPDRIAKLIDAGVSGQDVTNRAQLALASSFNAPKETKDALQNLYGVGQDGLAAFYLDPDESLPFLQKMSAASAIAGAASQSAFSLDRATAETAVDNGLTTAQAQQSFGQAAQERGLTSEGDLSTNDLLGAAVGDTGAALRVQQKQQARKASVSGGGQSASDQSGFTGLSRSTA